MPIEQHEGQRGEPARQDAHANVSERHADRGGRLGEVVIPIVAGEACIVIFRRDEDQREYEEAAHRAHHGRGNCAAASTGSPRASR